MRKSNVEGFFVIAISLLGCGFSLPVSAFFQDSHSLDVVKQSPVEPTVPADSNGAIALFFVAGIAMLAWSGWLAMRKTKSKRAGLVIEFTQKLNGSAK